MPEDIEETIGGAETAEERIEAAIILIEGIAEAAREPGLTPVDAGRRLEQIAWQAEDATAVLRHGTEPSGLIRIRFAAPPGRAQDAQETE